MSTDDDSDVALEMTSEIMSREDCWLEMAAGLLPSDEYLGFVRTLATAEDPETHARLLASLEERVQRQLDAVAHREEQAATLARHVFPGRAALLADSWVAARMGSVLRTHLPAVRRYCRRQCAQAARAGLA